MGLRTALVTTLYPGIEPFIGAWYRSVRAQSDTDFDLCVILDGLDAGQSEAAGGPSSARWIVVDGSAGYGAVRQAGFSALVSDYDIIVSVDADDELETDRVSSAKATIANADLVACGMTLVDAAGADMGRRFVPPVDPDWDAFLPSCNAIGLSNSTWRADALASCLPIAPAAVMVDWYLATVAAAGGARIATDTGIRMRYRQHGRTIARVVPPFDGAELLLAGERVIAHCGSVTDRVAGIGAWASRLQQRADSVREFVDSMADGTRRAAYVRELNHLPGPHYWWQPVAHDQLRHLWKN